MAESTGAEIRRKPWQQDGSLATQPTTKRKARAARRRRAEYEAERRSMEAWADGGFTSGG